MQEFEQTLTFLLSNHKNDREKGEKSLHNFLPLRDFYKYLIYGFSLQENFSNLSVILFRQKYLENKRFLELTVTEQEDIQNYLYSVLCNEKNLGFLKNIGYLLVLISNLLDNFEKLITKVLEWANMQDMQEFSIFIIESILEQNKYIIEKYENLIIKTLWELVLKSGGKPELLSCKVLCTVISVFNLNPPQDFCEKISSVITSQSSSECLYMLLESLSHLFESNPLFKSDPILISILSIGKNPSIPIANRTASYYLLSLLDFKVLNQVILQEILAVGFTLMTEIEYYNDIVAWNTDNIELEAISNDNFSIGKSIVAGIAEVNFAQVYVNELTNAHLATSHWVHKHAGIIAFGILASHTQKYLANVPAILTYLTDTHPRLQWAALVTVIGLFSTYSPFLQSKLDVLPLILPLIDSNFFKIQHQAIVALRYFYQGLDNIENDAIKKFTNDIAIKIYNILSNPTLNAELLSETLFLLGAFSRACQNFFLPYAEKFVIGIQNIIHSSGLASIVASAITCMTCMIMSLNNNEYVENVFSDLLRMIGKDEVIDNAVIENLPIYTKKFEELFAKKYASGVFSILFNYASCEIGKMNEENEAKRAVLVSFQYSLVENMKSKPWVLNTDDLTKKITACKCLFDLTKLKIAIKGYEVEIIKLFGNLINYKYSKKIRYYAISGIIELCSIDHFPENNFELIINVVLEGLLKPASYKNIEKILDLLNTLLSNEKIWVLVHIDLASQVTQLIVSGLSHYFSLSHCEKHKNSCGILKASLKSSEFFIKHLPLHYQSTFKTHLRPLLLKILEDPKSESLEIIQVLSIFCDYIDYTNDCLSESGCLPILEYFLKYCYSKNLTIRHNAAYGISAMASISPLEFKGYIEFCIKALKSILDHPKSKNEYLETSECAAGALAKVSLMHRIDLIPLWIGWFPLKVCSEDLKSLESLFLSNLASLTQYGNIEYLLNVPSN